MEQKEIDLVKRAKKGDTAAFDELVRLHDRRILQVAYSILDNLHDAQDVYQETFLRAYANIGSYRFEANFSTWLARIVVNLSINKRKQRQRRRWFSLDDVTDSRLSDESKYWQQDEATDQNTLTNEFYERIHRSLDTLSRQQRAAFTLKHLHGYKITEIAEMMGCAEGTVKNYLFRATQKLKKKLRPFYGITG